MDVRVGLQRKLSTEELMLLNCDVGEDSWESLREQGDPTSPSYKKSVLNIPWKDWCWSWNTNILATWCEELTHWKRPWCWERWKVGGEGNDRGWDGWMASPIQQTWVWVSSRSWWWTGKPGFLQSIGSKRLRHNWVTEPTDWHVWMWEFDHKEGWAPKNWCFWTVVLEKTLEIPLGCKEIKPVNPKGNQPWIFIGRTDAEAEAPILCPPDAKGQFTGKDPDAGKDWKQEKGVTDDEMAGWHHWHMDMNLNKPHKIMKDREARGAAIHVTANSWTQLSKWTTTNT